MLKTIATAGLYLAGILLLIFIWVRHQQKQGLYHPTVFDESWFDNLPSELREVSFKTEDDVKLWGVWKKGQPGNPVLIMAHGNGGDLRRRIYWFDLVLPEGFHGLIFDYRGYGASEGSPSERGLYRDIKAAIDYATANSGSSVIYLHGRSLGTAVVARGALERKVSGVILESGFPSAAKAAETILPLPGIRKLLSIDFETVSYLKQAQEKYGPFPKLIIHGSRDEVLPFRLGEKLYETAPAPKEKWYIESAGHNNLIQAAGVEKYSQKLREFLTENRE